MIDSVTIFSKTGVILYHHHNNDSTPNNEISPSLQTTLNTFLSLHLQSPTEKRITLSIDNNNIISEWSANDDYMIVVLYSRVVLEQNAGGLGMNWIQQSFLPDLMKEFLLFKKHVDYTNDGNNDSSTDSDDGDNELFLMDKCHLFNATFDAIYQKCESQGRLDKMNHNYSSNNISSMDGSTSTNSLSSMTQKGKKKKGKEDRVWFDGGEQKVTSKTMAKLDRSKKDDRLQQQDGNDDPMFIPDSAPALMEARAAYLPSEDEVPSWEHEDVLDDDGDDNADNDNSEKTSSTNGWGSSLKGMMGQFSGKYLTDDDLDVPLEEMEKMLTGKNVAREIAQDICLTVRKKLVGKKMASFTRVKTAVRQALEMAIEKILRPGRGRGGGEEVELLRNVVSKRESGMMGKMFGASSSEGKRPYVIVMVGINGVGKSTSLAKIAYYLKSNNCNPLLAACDTFRSGAVEQLNVHAKCLNVPLYQKGYAKDPASVATAAIDHATKEGNDVVLVDTAGRMQNNIPLMKALSNLVVQNSPDLVLFVCEALVGNDGMDQLDMFNKALRSGGHKRRIDGIVLTKFDTVSDKVGAALTLTKVTGAPVVFVGTGQKYTHLKKLSVQSIIKSLFT